MKKFLAILCVLMLGSGVMAQDAITEAVTAETNGLNFNDNKVAIGLQRHPATEAAQNITAKNNWFCIVLQYVGTPKLPKTEESAETATE